MSIAKMGDFREELGREAVNRVEEYANKIPESDLPAYIVVAAKADRFKSGVINATIQHYKERPPLMLGLLVWYADKKRGILEFKPELSLPPDIPLDEQNLSNDPHDQFENIASQGAKANVLLS